MKKNESINLMIHTEEWKPDGFLLPEQRKIRKVSSWSGAAESEKGEISRRGCERVIIITCSDQGIAAAGKMHLPVIAVRNPQYDRIRGEQSLFGAPLLLERTEDLEEPLLEEVWKRHYGIPLTIGQTPVSYTHLPGDFTSAGHFIVLCGIKDNGEIIVHDPNSRKNSEKSWDLERLMSQIKNLWSYSI